MARTGSRGIWPSVCLLAHSSSSGWSTAGSPVSSPRIAAGTSRRQRSDSSSPRRDQGEPHRR
ncbi:hypothetical protein [Micromonospora rubida]